MDYSSPNPNDGASPSRGPLSADDALPPVEAPSAGFIVKLFVIPGVIVTIIVLVWLLFNWLAQMGGDPKAYVDAIKRNNEGRWQAAVNLANALNNEKGPGFLELRRNSDVVQELAAVLDAEIAGGSMDVHQIDFRFYLCKALGSFEVADGLPVLIKAVGTRRDPAEVAVQRSAIQAIALLTENMRRADSNFSWNNAELTNALLTASRDEDPLVRESAAYTLGVIGENEMLERLHSLVDDANPNVRYNAATGLARHGDAAAIPMLLEMIDPNEDAGVKIEEEQSQDYKQALIQFNGIRGIATLLDKNSHVDRKQFLAPIEQLLQSKPPNSVASEAKNLLRSIQP